MIKERIKKLDFISPTYDLTIDGEERVQSFPGGVLVICYFGVLLAFSGYSLYDYFNNTRYDVVDVTTSTLAYPQDINLLKYRAMPFIRVAGADLHYLTAEEVNKRVHLHYRVTSATNNSKPVKMEEFYFMNCTEAIPDYKERLGYLENLNQTELEQGYLCLNYSAIENVIFKGKEGLSDQNNDPLFRYGSLYVGPCDLSRAKDSSYCQGTLTDFYDLQINVGFIQTTLNLNNYKHPVAFYINWDKWLFIDPETFSYYNHDVVVNTIVDNNGLPYPLYERSRFVTTELVTTTQIPLAPEEQKAACDYTPTEDGQDCVHFILMDFYSALTSVENLRTYKPITDVLGTIGGVKEMILLFFTYVHLFFFNSGVQKKFMVEKIFGIVPAVTTRFLCCKKHKGEPGQKNSRGSFFVTKEQFEAAYTSIFKSIDICTLTHEMFILRFLSSALLRDYQLNLMPLIALNNFCSEEEKSSLQASNSEQKGNKSRKNSQSPLPFTNGMKNEGEPEEMNLNVRNSNSQGLRYYGYSTKNMVRRYQMDSKEKKLHKLEIEKSWDKLKHLLASNGDVGPLQRSQNQERVIPESIPGRPERSWHKVRSELTQFLSYKCYQLLTTDAFHILPRQYETEVEIEIDDPALKDPKFKYSLSSPSGLDFHQSMTEGPVVPPYSQKKTFT